MMNARTHEHFGPSGITNDAGTKILNCAEVVAFGIRIDHHGGHAFGTESPDNGRSDRTDADHNDVAAQPLGGTLCLQLQRRTGHDKIRHHRNGDREQADAAEHDEDAEELHPSRRIQQMDIAQSHGGDHGGREIHGIQPGEAFAVMEDDYPGDKERGNKIGKDADAVFASIEHQSRTKRQSFWLWLCLGDFSKCLRRECGGTKHFIDAEVGPQALGQPRGLHSEDDPHIP